MSVLFDDHDRSVCVLGLGYVGLTLAATLADVGFDVHGIEIRDEVRDGLNRSVPHFYEPGLPEMLERGRDTGRFSVAKNITEETRARVYIVTVGTPLGDNGISRLDMVMNVSQEIAGALREGDLVVMRSTVKIGTTREIVMPILDQAGVAYDIAFCPERTLEGQALPELRHLPQIVGGQNEAATNRAAQLFQMMTPTTVRVGSIEAAETIKLIDNSQRDVQFGFANEVARICDSVGVSAEEVIRAGKLGYPRTNLPMPGPVGGPCLEKDSYILAESVNDGLGELAITMAARHLNEQQPFNSVAAIRLITDQLKGFPDDPMITLAGVAFKGRPVTDDLRGTMARPILAALKASYPTAQFRGYDGVVAPAGIREVGLEPVGDLQAAFEQSDLVVIANNHPGFETMPLARLASSMNSPGLIYDFWNNFQVGDLSMPDGIHYVALGSHNYQALMAINNSNPSAN
jgi:UDP-N-acetyl-D-mannosaminuronic acid dehydrogenase